MRTPGGSRFGCWLTAALLLCWVVTAEPGRVIDGDTFEAKLAIWVNTFVVERVRVLGVDTPELKAPTLDAGHAARQFTANWLSRTADVTVAVCKRDHFGRLLGVVTRGDDNLAEDLIRAGHGKAR